LLDFSQILLRDWDIANFYYNPSISKQVHIPSELIQFNKVNTICIRIFEEEVSFSVPKIDFGDYWEYLFQSEVVNFLSVRIYLTYSILCLTIGTYYLLQFFFRKKEITNLYFSLTNFCFCFYFINMGLDINFIPYRIASIISRSFLPLFFGLLIIIFINYLNIFNYKWFKRIIMSKAIILSALFYLNAGEKYIIPGYFSIVLIPSAIELILMVIITTGSFIKKNKDVLPLMIGAWSGFLFGIYDMIHQIMGLRPFIWLQGYGIFLFNLSMFVALSIKNMRAFNDLEIYSKEIVNKTEKLEVYINNINDVSNTVSNIGDKLEKNITSTSASMEKMTSNS